MVQFALKTQYAFHNSSALIILQSANPDLHNSSLTYVDKKYYCQHKVYQITLIGSANKLLNWDYLIF